MTHMAPHIPTLEQLMEQYGKATSIPSKESEVISGEKIVEQLDHDLAILIHAALEDQLVDYSVDAWDEDKLLIKHDETGKQVHIVSATQTLKGLLTQNPLHTLSQGTYIDFTTSRGKYGTVIAQCDGVRKLIVSNPQNSDLTNEDFMFLVQEVQAMLPEGCKSN